jgi:hypothetical protein
MKPIAILLALAFASCVKETTTRRNDDGSKSVIESYRPTDRAGSLLDAVVRDRLRLPQGTK